MIVLDEQLQGLGIEDAISRWYPGAAMVVKQLRPGTVMKGKAIPSFLRQVRQPTFVTINDTDFWRRIPADQSYWIVCLRLTTEQVDKVADWIRRLFGLPEFKTKNVRMGRVALVSQRRLQYYCVHEKQVHMLRWPTR